MAVLPGSRLGPYEIVAQIGAGGMGEVWRGRDTRLGRDVAVKILPDHIAQNEQFRARFDREAKTISSLNHPNICTLFDVGEHDSMSFIIMELIEGESLADRLSRGALPPDQVLRYGAQIAEALDRAHKQGITHRDLKPGNVMITKSGAKLLDFGLARADSHDGGIVRGLTEMPTQAKPLTQEGMILGTFQYMAPEQLEGTEADARTDIFALGALLHEMATGQRAFQGSSRTSLIAAIVSSHPPPISQLVGISPPALDHIVRRCLEKDPEDRWQSAHDVAAELRWISEAGSQAGVAAPISARRKSRERLAWGLSIVAAVLAFAAAWAFFHRSEPPHRLLETSLSPPAGLRSALNGGMAISRDGTMAAIVFNNDRGEQTLWLRALANDGYRQLDGTNNAAYPFWSPNGRSVGFFAEGKLKIIDLADNGVRILCDAPNPRGGAWSESGTIILTQSSTGPMVQVAATGGVPAPLTSLRSGEASHRWPFFIPGSGKFIFLATGNGAPRILSSSLDEPTKIREVAKRSSSAQYTAPGVLLFARDQMLVAQRYDKNRGSVIGEPVTIGDRLATTDRFNSLFTVSADGLVLFQRGPGFRESQIVWMGRDGKVEGAVSPAAGLLFCPALSHDGRRMAVDVSSPVDGQGDLWIYDLSRNVSSRLTYTPGNDSTPNWSNDDKQIIYYSNVVGGSGGGSIKSISAGGTGKEETVSAGDFDRRATALSRDGKWIVFNAVGGAAGTGDLWIWSTEEKKARAWLSTPFIERCAHFSPDSKWIAYESDESGRSEIYIRSFPDGDEKWRISTSGGFMPEFRADGRELFYISGERKMMAVSLSTSPTFQASVPVQLFDAPVRDHPTRQYDVTPDGKHFLINRLAESGPPEPISVLQGWDTKLR